MKVSNNAMLYTAFGNGREIAVWGTGKGSPPIPGDLRLFCLDVSFFVSKDWFEKNVFMERRVLSKDLLDKSKHYVVIGSTLFNDEIAGELMEMGFEKNKDFAVYKAAEIKILSFLQERLSGSRATKVEIFPSHCEISLEIVNSMSIKMYVDDTRFEVPNVILEYGSYESTEEKMMYRVLSCLPENAVIFDIGANGGYYSLCYKTWFPNTSVHAFEPVHMTYQTLLKNIALNKTVGINAKNFGFYDKEQTIDFYFDFGDSGCAGVRNNNKISDSNVVSCFVTTMDSYVDDADTRVDFIKIDVEGAELFAFRGGCNSLQKYKPVIFAEMVKDWCSNFKYHPDDIVSFLADIGYSCYEMESDCLSPVEKIINSGNYFFIHSAGDGRFVDIIKKLK